MQSVGKFHRLAQQLRQFLRRRLQRNFASGPPLGRPRCDIRISRPPRSRTFLDRRQRLHDAAIVGDLPFSTGTLKSTRINTLFPAHIDIGNCFLP
jgi:hypothetical protein